MTRPYAFELRWLPENAQPQPDSPSDLFTAIQEQLGLRLEAQRSAIEVILVDYVDSLSPN